MDFICLLVQGAGRVWDLEVTVGAENYVLLLPECDLLQQLWFCLDKISLGFKWDSIKGDCRWRQKLAWKVNIKRVNISFCSQHIECPFFSLYVCVCVCILWSQIVLGLTTLIVVREMIVFTVLLVAWLLWFNLLMGWRFLSSQSFGFQQESALQWRQIKNVVMLLYLDSCKPHV